MLCFVLARGRGVREAREGQGLEGEQKVRDKVHLNSQLCSLADASDAQMQMMKYRLEGCQHDLNTTWCKKTDRLWEPDKTAYLIQAIFCPTQEFFPFVHFPVCYSSVDVSISLRKFFTSALLSLPEDLAQTAARALWPGAPDRKRRCTQIHRRYTLKWVCSLGHLLIQKNWLTTSEVFLAGNISSFMSTHCRGEQSVWEGAEAVSAYSCIQSVSQIPFPQYLPRVIGCTANGLFTLCPSPFWAPLIII